MTNTTPNYAVYTLKGLPTGVFGEAYAVVTGTKISVDKYRAEHFILTQRPQEALHSGVLDIAADTFPAELGAVDEKFSIDEGLRQAEIDIQEMLEARSIELGRPDIAYLRFELRACASPFVGCKMRGRFVPQLEAMRKATKCPQFERYLGLIQQINFVRHAG